MHLTRQELEEREKQFLAPYAVLSMASRGRKYPEPEGPYRTCFQRDRDRIIHIKAFRRLKGKTQVFIASFGDHYRSRLAHSMAVAQFSRDIARTLGLNEDLAEAIALAHDLGHTPFGHAGQDEMHLILKAYGDRFEHNEQSRRIVEIFERKSPHFPGLNLTFEVRDGLIKHRTPYDQPVATDTLMPTLEAQVVNLADEIAYLNHDIDDGLRSGILTFNALDQLALWKQVKTAAATTIPFDLRVNRIISALTSLMVNDLTLETQNLINHHGITNVEQIYKTPFPLVGFSDPMRALCNELKTFLYHHFYQSPPVAEYNKKGKEVIRFLFERIIKNPELLPEHFQEALKSEKPHVVVKDYIAGMTDNFALELYDQLKNEMH